MKWNHRHWIGGVLPSLFLLLALLMDFGAIQPVTLPGTNIPFHEILLSMAVIFFVWGALQIEWFRERTIPQKLRCLILSVFALWMLVRVVGLKSFQSTVQTQTSFPHPSFSPLAPIAVMYHLLLVTLVIMMFVCLKELIFVQQTKRTASHFQVLRYLLFLFMFVTLLSYLPKFSFDAGFGPVTAQQTGQHLLLALVGFHGFLNGFRCKWIHYLNKPQKAVTFLALVLTTGALIDLIIISMTRTMHPSIALGAFTQGIVFIVGIYVGMASLGILLILPSAGLMDRRISVIKTLQALSATVGSAFEMDDLVTKTTQLAMEVVDADCAWIEIKSESLFKLAGSYRIREEDVESIPETVSKEIRRQVKESEQALLLNDLGRMKLTRDIKKWHRKAGSVLASRIEFKKNDLGILYALKSDRFGFSDENIGLFRAFADQVGVAIENVNLLQVTIEQQVYHEELRLAHDAQMRLLPSEMPSIKGLDLNAFCMTANEIGGDFYDIIEVDDERLDVVIGDVSGKGASAAFYMAELKGVIQALAPHFTSPKKMLVEINTFLVNHFESDTFATMVYSMIFPRKKQMRIVRAGHPPAGLIRKNSVSWLETDGLGLGLAANEVLTKTLKEQNKPLKKGDTLFFYTDGLIEARNAQGEEYGEDKLEKTLLELDTRNASEMLDEICSRLKTFTRGVPMHDDMTIVALRVMD